jgi:hypothetical protein
MKQINQPKLLSFHNDPAIKEKYLNRDEIIQGAINNKFIVVDPDKGTIELKRFGGRLARCKNKKGYVVFTLHYNGERIQVKAHRAVWIAKYGLPCPEIIDHINRIKDDNRVINLRDASPRLNSNNRRSYKGVNNPASKINKKIAESIRSDYAEIRSYSKTADKYKVSKSTVANIIKQRSWVV